MERQQKRKVRKQPRMRAKEEKTTFFFFFIFGEFVNTFLKRNAASTQFGRRKDDQVRSRGKVFVGEALI